MDETDCILDFERDADTIRRLSQELHDAAAASRGIVGASFLEGYSSTLREAVHTLRKTISMLDHENECYRGLTD